MPTKFAAFRTLPTEAAVLVLLPHLTTLLFHRMATQEEFQQAADRAQQLPKKPDNMTLLKLYALYKQGTEGDVSGDRPGGFDFKAIAKYDAWSSLSGKGQEEARQEYVDLVNQLFQQA
jgi:diazepam-binding inhibitor (GABA receptor modulator, acyl-CoA-binding protein)